jgi:hypothetical protein
MNSPSDSGKPIDLQNSFSSWREPLLRSGFTLLEDEDEEYSESLSDGNSYYERIMKKKESNENFKGKLITTEAFDIHIKKNIPLTESKYPKNSKEYKNLLDEARYLYSREVIDLNKKDTELILKENQDDIKDQIESLKNKIKSLPGKTVASGGGIPSSKSKDGINNDKLRKKEENLRSKLELLYKKEEKSLKENQSYKKGDTVKFPYTTKNNIVSGEFVRYEEGKSTNPNG